MSYNCISHICIADPKPGELAGSCVLCGNPTIHGFPLPFSNSFTGFSFLTAGDCTCPHCYHFMKNQNFRKKSWVADRKEVVFLKRIDIIPFLTCSPPDPPFAIYLTRTGKRQGWLDGFQFVNFSADRFHLLTDFAGAVYIDIRIARGYYNLIKNLRNQKVSKTALRSGEYALHIYKKALIEGWSELIEQARENVRDPSWEVMVYVAE